LHDLGRIEYASVDDRAAIEAFHNLAATEGILPALESAHALAHVRLIAPFLNKRAIVLVNLSGRGDKDVDSVMRYDEEAARRENEDPGGLESSKGGP
jgi:tryptophan synthase beta chain